MDEQQPEQLDERVLVLAPTERDAATSRGVLEAAGVRCVICGCIEDVCREAERGAGAAVVTAEAILADKDRRLAACLQTQPPWSDFPLVVLIPPGAETPRLLRALAAVGHMTFMKRPVQVSTLLSTVQSALRDRRRQYVVRDLLVERQRAADTLRVERERYRVTLSSIGDAVIATDTAGRVTFLNPVAEQLTDWDSNDAKGRPLEEVFRIINEATRRPVHNPALRALKEGVIVGLANHTILIARDGTERPLDDSAAPIRGVGGEIVGAVLVFRDITEKKLAEAAVRESEGRFRTLFESMDEGFCVAEVLFNAQGRPADYRFLEVNPAFEKQCGLRDATGKTMRELVPDHDAHWFEIYGKVALTGEAVRFVNEAKALDGRWFNVYAFRLGGPDSRKVAILFTDITAHKRASEALKDADRRKDEFIALLAHELRNPLAPLRNGLQVMRLAGSEPGAVTQARGMMERQLGHMVRLIDDLLDISRISQNKMELRRKRVLLSDVVGCAVETARPALEEAGHQFTVALPPEPVYLDADLTRLAQVFSNLLTNSAKYTDRGGRVWLSGERRGEEVVVSVRDTGIGIPAESLGNIFNMFSQVDRSIERSTGGLGIGLALVKGLVEMHGGTVTAASEGQGQGSTFAVTLPVEVDQAVPKDLSADSGQNTARPKRRILVVDDNRDGADSLAMMLRLIGDEVHTAHDGIEAVEQAEVFRPEIVLMDVGMPRLNGLEATRASRAGVGATLRSSS